jgi:hypothetical protein
MTAMRLSRLIGKATILAYLEGIEADLLLFSPRLVEDVAEDSKQFFAGGCTASGRWAVSAAIL